MQIHVLFKQTMDIYKIQGKELATLAGITPHHLSQFRSGHKWVSSEVFTALLIGMDQLAPGSRRYFCELLAGSSTRNQESGNSIVEMINAADDDEIEQALLAIGRKWKRIRQNETISNYYNPELKDVIAV